MKFILDFDDVLFNTEALKRKLVELGLDGEERGPDLLDRISEADPTFDITTLIYPDAREFLAEFGEECMIVSSYHSKTMPNDPSATKQYRAFQAEKIERSGALSNGAHLELTPQDKYDVLRELQREAVVTDTPYFFIDDNEHHLHEAKELGLVCVKMERTTRDAFGFERPPFPSEFPVVRTMTEFMAYCKAWKPEPEQLDA